jgi:hypothetical protein
MWRPSPSDTPAMVLGIADHVWSIGELIDAALAVAPRDPAETPHPCACRGLGLKVSNGGQRRSPHKRAAATGAKTESREGAG